MELTFESYLSAHTRRWVELTVYPDAKARDFLTDTERKEGGEATATVNEYDFPDNAVVVALIEFGDAVATDADDPESTAIEVHIGPEADPLVIEAAEAAARDKAAEIGISDDASEALPGYAGFWIIRH
jgi:hypothetical protein